MNDDNANRISRGQYFRAPVEFDGNVYFKERGAVLLRVDANDIDADVHTALPRSTLEGTASHRPTPAGCVRSNEIPPLLDKAAMLFCESPLCLRADVARRLAAEEPAISDVTTALKEFLTSRGNADIPVIGLFRGAIWIGPEDETAVIVSSNNAMKQAWDRFKTWRTKEGRISHPGAQVATLLRVDIVGSLAVTADARLTRRQAGMAVDYQLDQLLCAVHLKTLRTVDLVWSGWRPDLRSASRINVEIPRLPDALMDRIVEDVARYLGVEDCANEARENVDAV